MRFLPETASLIVRSGAMQQLQTNASAGPSVQVSQVSLEAGHTGALSSADNDADI